tara:strand:+ start:475 stop:1743 length:1269 start_codon:yes stop_codon:yes gene_type:complete
MRIWLIQRAESTPHDDNGNRRLMRIGILADILRAKGHEVIWWTSAFDHVVKKKRYQKSTRVLVKSKYYIHYLKCFGYKKNISISRFIDDIIVSRQFEKDVQLEKIKPDMILTSVPSIELSQKVVNYANKHNIPVVLDIRDLWPDVFFELLPKSLSWFVKIFTIPMRRKLSNICKKASYISGITDDFIDWGIKHSERTRSEKDLCFPMAYVRENISEEKKIEAYSFWKKLGILKNDGIINVLFIGTFTKSFEFQTVFLAAKILQSKNAPVRFIFCGVGMRETEIKDYCRDLNNCIFAGWINTAQIQTILKLSDVGLAPYIHTKNFLENFPNKPAEYLSENLLIATSLKSGKLFNFINSKQCGISYGKDQHKLASFIDNLANNKSYLHQLTKKAEEAYAEGLDGKKVYDSMANFLEKLKIEHNH